jgi:acyl carrier protein
MKTNIMQKVKSALIEVLNLTQEVEISAQSKLKDDLGLDSMSSLTFLMTLEENIGGFVVDPDVLEMSDLDTVMSIVRYVENQIGDNSRTENSQFNESHYVAQVAYA